MYEWERILERTPAVSGRDLPGALGLLAAHAAPLAAAVPVDWLPLVALAAFSALWPQVRVAGGPVAQWFVGIGNVQPTGELHDELYRTVAAAGDGLVPVTAGGVFELATAVQGQGRAALAYYTDGGAFVRSTRASTEAATLAALLISGRDAPGAAQPSVAAVMAVSLSDLVVSATRRDWATGWLGRALLCLPNARRAIPETYPTPEERSEVAGRLAEHVAALAGIAGIAWTDGRSARLAVYAKMLGATGGGEVVVSDEEPDAPAPLLYVIQAQRVAALLALADADAEVRGDTICVEERHVECAVRLTERARAYAMRTAESLGKTRQAEVVDKVVEVLAKQGEMTAREILIARRLKGQEAHTALRLLMQDGRVTGRQDGRRYLFRLVHDGA